MEISFLSWNINGEHYRLIHRATLFYKIVPKLSRYLADIICLQEFPKAREKNYTLPFFKKYSQYYSGDDCSCTLSRFPVVRSGELLLHKILAPFNPGTVIWTEIDLGKGVQLKVYNCHFSIEKIGIASRIKLLEFVLGDASKHGGPTVVCEDMNTTIPAKGLSRKIISWFYGIPRQELIVDGKYCSEDERYFFSKTANRYGFTEALNLSDNTWGLPRYKLTPFKIKLDWFLVRGIRVSKATLGPYISDHRPILIKCIV